MKAGGISIYRITMPIVALGLVLSLGLFAWASSCCRTRTRSPTSDFNVIKGRPPQSSSYLDRRWILGSDGRFYNYEYVAGSAQEQSAAGGAAGLVAVRPLGLRRRPQDLGDAGPSLRARAAWIAAASTTWTAAGAAASARTLASHLRERKRGTRAPSYFRQEERDSDTLRFGELREHIAALRRWAWTSSS